MKSINWLRKHLFIALVISLLGISSAFGSAILTIPPEQSSFLTAAGDETKITVSAASNWLIYPGSLFRFKVSLTRNNVPLPHEVIGIYDPILLMCNFSETDQHGEFFYDSQTTPATTPSIYGFVFVYKDVRKVFYASVGLVNAINLSTFKLDAIGTDMNSNRAMVTSKRTPDQPLSQTVDGTMAEAENFAFEISKEILSNPGSTGVILFTGLSCAVALSTGAPPRRSRMYRRTQGYSSDVWY